MTDCIVIFPQQIGYYKKYESTINKLFLKNKLKIHKPIYTKIQLEHIIHSIQSFGSVSKNFVTKIQYDCVELPIYLVNVLEKKIPGKKNFNFYSNKHLFKISFDELELFTLTNIEEHLTTLIGIKTLKEPMVLRELIDEVVGEINSFAFEDIDIKMFVDLTNSNSTYHQLLKMNYYLLFSSVDFTEFILFNELFIIVFANDFISFIPCFEHAEILNSSNKSIRFNLITYKNFYLKHDDKIINIRVDNYIDNHIIRRENTHTDQDHIYRIYGYIKDTNKQELLNFSIGNDMVMKKFYNYENKETKTKIKSNGLLNIKTGEEYCKYTKNQCDFEEYYNPVNRLHKVVSQCMISNDTTGLRFRGKYSQTTIGDKTKKTIQFDEKTVREKDGGNVRTDLLERKIIKEGELVIGYKIAKSASGELRVIKLGIFPDSRIIRPIDSEYFITFGKERCDKAIVMDIQLPDKYTETSVVPEEHSAYSYVFKTSGTNGLGFEYKIGQEVIPDSFDLDEDNGCAHGIHFYSDRMNVFKAFVDK